MKVGQSLVLLGGLLLLMSCSRVLPKDYYYRVQLDNTAIVKEQTPLIKSVVVQNFQALGLLRERNIVYVPDSSPNEVRQYNYHSWIEVPAILFQQLMVDFLQQSNLSELVVTPRMHVDAEYEIRGRVDRFELVQTDSPRVVLKMEIVLRSVKQNRMIYLGRYQQEIPLLKTGVNASVSALSDAVNQVYQQFFAELRDYLLG
ncbi:MAG: hypothetical protein GXP22_10330 [Gammaproteobacteria bacterium]|nr:hypothetical protein [Gammaproteobacteria bacterium]